jgi:FkbM family methyltransferase
MLRRLRRSCGRLAARFRQFKLHRMTRCRPRLAFARLMYVHLTKPLRGRRPRLRFQLAGGRVQFVSHYRRGSLTGMYCYGLADFEEMSFLLHLLRPGDLFLDAGANAGAYTVLASGWVGAESVAYEPVPETFAVLRENLDANRLGALATARRAALGGHIGTETMTAECGQANSIVQEPGLAAGDVIEVELTTADEDLPRTPILAKIDIEGHELEFIRGATRILADDDFWAIIIELSSPMSQHAERIHQSITAVGFDPVRYSPEQRQVAVSEGYRRDAFNTIYVRRNTLDKVRERLRTSDGFRIRGHCF